MTTILWPGAGQTASSLNTGTTTDLASGLSARAGAVSSDARSSLSANTTAQLSSALAAALSEALSQLGQRIGAVEAATWPGGQPSPAQADTQASLKSGRSGGTDAPAQPSRSISSGFDPDALTTLAPGTYTLSYMLGQSGAEASATIKINSGDTWQDVLSRMARIFGSASVAMASQLVPAKGASGFATNGKRSGAENVGLAGLPKLSDALADVLASYNEVTDLLTRNKGEVKPGALRDWTAAASERATALSAVGVERTGHSLWLSEQDFLTAVLAQPETARSVLAGADGLLPALKDQAESVLAGVAQDSVSAAASAKAGQGGPDLLTAPLKTRTEVEVEKSSQLLDLYDTKSGFDPGAGQGAGARLLVSKKG